MNGMPVASIQPIGLSDDLSDRLAAAFDAHHERLFRLARRLTSNRDDALDLVQETFLRAARSPRSFPVGPTGEEAWLVRVLINVRRDQWRRTVVRERHDPEMRLSSCSVGNQEAAVIGPCHGVARARTHRAAASSRRRHARTRGTGTAGDRVVAWHQRSHGSLAPVDGTPRSHRHPDFSTRRAP
jgi:hypothetical protein